MKNYTVTLGDTLFGIARREYGDGGLYPVIAEQNHLEIVIANANNLDPATDLVPGQVLIVPALNRRRHVAGDTLESLCVEEYGDDDVGTRVAVAAAANYLGRPLNLFSNQVVYFPS